MTERVHALEVEISALKKTNATLEMTLDVYRQEKT